MLKTTIGKTENLLMKSVKSDINKTNIDFQSITNNTESNIENILENMLERNTKEIKKNKLLIGLRLCKNEKLKLLGNRVQSVKNAIQKLLSKTSVYLTFTIKTLAQKKLNKSGLSQILISQKLNCSVQIVIG